MDIHTLFILGYPWISVDHTRRAQVSATTAAGLTSMPPKQAAAQAAAHKAPNVH